MQLFKTVCVLLTLGALLAQPAAAQVSLGAQGPRRRTGSPPAMAGAVARFGYRRSRDFVSPARRRAVPAGDRRACDLAKRAASRANAAAGISRFGGVAGGAGIRGAGAGAAGSRRDRRALPRGSRRLRRGGLCQGRPRHGGLHRSGAGFYARAILRAAGRRGDRRPLRGRDGARWRSPREIRKASQRSSRSRRDVAAMPTICPIRSARRIR